ncbi:hypothetical protein SAJA_02710 [Salinisphaera japonica YTM-1]|uniref:Uncharacterized protein n=1 Tax=Salinisphaera japonica YTM-1 TaxID=1209778 RepID=A0A423Q0E8_9GAMM|nr:hypothetical protein SAJA_02710 [Salinisphaera japonica YTM-1]
MQTRRATRVLTNTDIDAESSQQANHSRPRNTNFGMTQGSRPRGPALKNNDMTMRAARITARGQKY